MRKPYRLPLWIPWSVGPWMAVLALLYTGTPIHWLSWSLLIVFPVIGLVFDHYMKRKGI